MDAISIILLCLGLLALATIIYFLASWYCNSDQKGLDDLYQPLSTGKASSNGTPYSDITVMVDAKSLDEPDGKLIREEGVYDSKPVEGTVYPKIIVGAAVAASTTPKEEKRMTEKIQTGSEAPEKRMYPDIEDKAEESSEPRRSSTPKEGIYESADDIKERADVESKNVPEGTLIEFEDETSPAPMILKSINYDDNAPKDEVIVMGQPAEPSRKDKDSTSISSEEGEDVQPESLIKKDTEERLADSDKELEAMTPSVCIVPMAIAENFDSDSESDATKKTMEKSPEAVEAPVKGEVVLVSAGKDEAEQDHTPERKVSIHDPEASDDVEVPRKDSKASSHRSSTPVDEVETEKPVLETVILPSDDTPRENPPKDDKSSISSSDDDDVKPTEYEGVPTMKIRKCSNAPLEDDQDNTPACVPDPEPTDGHSPDDTESSKAPVTVYKSTVEKFENGVHSIEVTLTTEDEEGKVIKEEKSIQYQAIDEAMRKKIHPDEGYGTIETSLDPDKSYEEIEENGSGAERENKDGSSDEEALHVPSKDNRHSTISDGAEANREVVECHVEKSFIEKKSETSV